MPKRKKLRYCEMCGRLMTDEDSPYAKNCSECRSYVRSPSGIPHYANTDYNSRDYAHRKAWTDRVNEKMEHIVAEGYAERQIADSLAKVEKIKTEL